MNAVEIVVREGFTMDGIVKVEFVDEGVDVSVRVRDWD